MERQKRLLVVVGMPGAGKSTFCKFAKELGFSIVSFGSIVREEVKKRGLKVTKENLARISLWFHSGREKLLAERLAERIERSRKRLFVVDGARCPEEIEVLKDRFGEANVLLVAVVLPKRLRYRRLLERKRFDTKSLAAIEERDRREVGYGLTKLITHANYKISNACSLAEFKEKVKEIIKKIMKRWGVTSVPSRSHR